MPIIGIHVIAEPKSQLQTLQRAFDVLRAVSKVGRALSMTEIANAIGTGPTIAHRIVKSLEANGYLEKDAQKRYRRLFNGDGTVWTLQGAIRLLQVISSAGHHGVQTKVLTAETLLTQAQVTAMLGMLADSGFVEQKPDGHWAISPGILAYARPLLSQDGQLATLRPLMRDLQATYGETISWFRRVGWHQVVVEALASPHPLRYVLDPGTRFPLYVGAAGKAHLAKLSTSEVDEYLANLRPAAFTRFTVDLDVLRRELRIIRSRGYAISFGERIEGAAAAAVAIATPEGEIAGVLGVMMPISRTSKAQLTSIAADLVSRTNDVLGRNANFRTTGKPG